MPLSSANHSYQRLHDMKTPPWWAETQASPDSKNIELQEHVQTMITMFEGLHWSTMLPRRKSGPRAVQHGFDKVLSFGLRPVSFVMNCNISLAIYIQDKVYELYFPHESKEGEWSFLSAVHPPSPCCFFHPGGGSQLRTALQMHRPLNWLLNGKPQCAELPLVTKKCWLLWKEIRIGLGPKWGSKKTVVHAKVVKIKWIVASW